MFKEKFLASLLTFFGQNYRLSLSDRIEDHSLFMEPVQRIPVMTLPGSAVATLSKKKQCKHRVVDFVFIVLHACDHECYEEGVEPTVTANAAHVALLS